MSTTKRIVCLANSRKLSGRCVAGREIASGNTGAWVRPVSDRPNQEVSLYERQYEDGSEPRVLDVIEIPLLGPCPDGYHSENWRLDPDSYWAPSGRLAPAGLVRFVDPVQPLWINGRSTRRGLNDVMRLEDARTLDSSLTLIRVPEVQLRVFANYEKRRVQACFDHAGVSYRLSVTDPECERRFCRHPDGDYVLESTFLTISIGEPLNGCVYKLVAAVIEEPKS